MKKDNLNVKAINGLKTMSISSVISFVLQFITTMVLARIFTPEQFGIVSAITIITSYTDIFWKVGIGPAIVQKKELTNNDINTGFITTITFGLLATALVNIFAPFLVKVINIDQVQVLRIISLSFIINSFGVIPLSIIQREMRFRIIMMKDILSSLVYTITAIILGICGFQVWGLVVALLMKYIIATLIPLIYYPIKINKSLSFNLASFKSMMKFGMGYSLSQFLSVTTSQGDYFVVTNVMNSYLLGIYTKAYQLMTVPANLIGQVVDQVFFPVMSKIQDNDRRLSDIYILSTALFSLLYFPVSIIIYLFSSEIVSLILGAKWIEVSVPFKILSLSLFFRVGYKICDPLFRAKGKVYNRALIHLVNAIITVMLAFIGSSWGLSGVAVGVSVALVINYAILSIKTYKIIKFNLNEYILCLLPFIILSSITIPLMKNVKNYLNIIILNNSLGTLVSLILTLGVLFILILIIYKNILPRRIREQINKLFTNLLKKFLKNRRG